MDKVKDGRAVALENEIRVLRALHRFGWLRTRDFAALIWNDWKKKPPPAGPTLIPAPSTAVGLRMAQRTLKRMRGKRLLLSSQAPNGSVIYALAEAGARVLRQIGVVAATGKDLLRSFSPSYFCHRRISNEIAIGAILEGFRVATEREIAQGRWLGGTQGIAWKKPDVLIRGGDSVWWIEVERSRKNAKDYLRLLGWLGKAGSDAFSGSSQLLGAGLKWGKIVFVCTAAFEAKLCADLQAAGWSNLQIESLLIFETSLYKFEDIRFL